VTHK